MGSRGSNTDAAAHKAAKSSNWGLRRALKGHECRKRVEESREISLTLFDSSLAWVLPFAHLLARPHLPASPSPLQLLRWRLAMRRYKMPARTGEAVPDGEAPVVEADKKADSADSAEEAEAGQDGGEKAEGAEAGEADKEKAEEEEEEAELKELEEAGEEIERRSLMRRAARGGGDERKGRRRRGRGGEYKLKRTLPDRLPERTSEAL